ncbi:MAG: SOS response-associated peptidase [Loktanella sp.]|nr:SOS response-associated peptidase [Loktanella sp.]
MCGRMAILLPHDAMARMFDAAAANDLPDVPNYNVCPTTQVHTVTSDGGRRHLRPMRWGFIPHWYKKPGGGPLLINARSETIADKPAFRAAARERRCLVVASGFYEWKRQEGERPMPYWVTRTDGAPMIFAGIWQGWEKDGEALTTCAVVTTAANATMAPVHDRLPVILDPDDVALWLGEKGKGAATLMGPAPDDALTLQRVGYEVNSNRASGPELIEPV